MGNLAVTESVTMSKNQQASTGLEWARRAYNRAKFLEEELREMEDAYAKGNDDRVLTILGEFSRKRDGE